MDRPTRNFPERLKTIHAGLNPLPAGRYAGNGCLSTPPARVAHGALDDHGYRRG